MQALGPIIAMVLQDAGMFVEGVDIEELCEALINVDFSKIGEGRQHGQRK
jgi:hypothetical protein